MAGVLVLSGICQLGYSPTRGRCAAPCSAGHVRWVAALAVCWAAPVCEVRPGSSAKCLARRTNLTLQLS
eukprot:8867061-Alexandrium_andersonii.AAC.1